MRSNLGSDPGQRTNLNNSWNGIWESNKAWDNDYEIKKPLRLEALPLVDNKTNSRFQKRDSNSLGLT